MQSSIANNSIFRSLSLGAIGIGSAALFCGYWFWLGVWFASGGLLVWLGGLGLCWCSYDQSEPPLWPRVVAGILHLLLCDLAIAGLVFILPKATYEAWHMQLASGLGWLGLVFGFLVIRYLVRQAAVQWAAAGRAIWWAWLLSLIAFELTDYAVPLSLVLFGLLLALGAEGLLRLLIQRHVKVSLLPDIVLEYFFFRWNPISSCFDGLERFFGIDIKGTWAIQFVRRAIEPLVVAMLVVAWLSSSWVMIHVHEQGVRENFGVPESTVLQAGLHWKLPYPLGQIQRVPAGRIHAISIGHQESEEEEEEEEEESILWANQHADEEMTLLLGDGRDLISVDGVLFYRIVDVHQYLYGHQNPAEQLQAIAYGVLMHETASRTLEQALSQNLTILAARVKTQIQQLAKQQQLGLEAVDFSFSALHPPVAVASEYQRVVSAQIDRDRQVVQAQAYRKKRLPLAKAKAQAAENQAKAKAAKRIAQATGEAKAFESLYYTVWDDPGLYIFRRRQEALQLQLTNKRLIVIDDRIEKQGGGLWIQD